MRKNNKSEENQLIGELISYYKELLPYPKPMFFTLHCPWGNNFSIWDIILPHDIQFMGTNNVPILQPRKARRVAINNNNLMERSRQEFLIRERWRRRQMIRHSRSRNRSRTRTKNPRYIRSRSRSRNLTHNRSRNH